MGVSTVFYGWSVFSSVSRIDEYRPSFSCFLVSGDGFSGSGVVGLGKNNTSMASTGLKLLTLFLSDLWTCRNGDFH